MPSHITKKPNPLKADPTRSATLRKVLVREFTKRFSRIKTKMLKLVVDEDAFGLRKVNNEFIGIEIESSRTTNSNAHSQQQQDRKTHIGSKRTNNRIGKETQVSRGCTNSAIETQQNPIEIERTGSNYPINTRWKARSTTRQLEAFQNWLQKQINIDVLEGATAKEIDDAYWQKYIEDGYRKGQGRAFTDVRKPANANNLDFFNGTREEFLRQSFGRPVSINKVKLLASRVLTDLKNVTDVMATQMSRVLVDGLIQGQNPRIIARNLADRIDKIGKTRATIIARTEITRAHAEGQLDALEQLGVEKVGVQVEWSTAGDDRVCPLCQPLEGTILLIKEARGILPRHPQCVTADSVVISPDLTTMMQANYTGEIFDFVTSFGRRISVTSHHIMLTQRGWVFAKDITNIDYFVDASLAYGHSIAPNNYLTKPTIGNVFRSFVEMIDKSFITKTLTMPEHLHGDGKFIDQEINIIDIDGFLRSNIQAIRNSQIIKRFLNIGSVSPIDSLTLNSQSGFSLLLGRLGNTTDSLMRSLGITDVLLARSVLHHQPVSVGISSDFNPLRANTLVDSSSAQTKLFTQSVDAHSLQIEFDNFVNRKLVGIKSITTRHVSNLPVYDVSTQSTLYTVNGILTSNCRCAFLPANVGESRALKDRPLTRFKDPKTGKEIARKIPVKTSKTSIEDALTKSIQAEIPKRSKRTIAQQKALTSWTGADKNIRKIRPKELLDSPSKPTLPVTKKGQILPTKKPTRIKPEKEISTRKQDAIDSVMKKLDQGLLGRGFDKAKKTEYREAVKKVLNAMPEKSVDRFETVVTKFEFYDDTKKLTAELNKRLKIPHKDEFAIQGAWDTENRILHLDGAGKADDTIGIYSHEFTHVLDWPNHKLSETIEWKKAWEEEIVNGVVKISDYSTTKPSEGFAEFGRLIYSDRPIAGQSGIDHAKSLYPKCFKIWNDLGLLP